MYTIDHFRPEDAEGLVALFHAVYGEQYPIRLFYDPAAIIEANREGIYISLVARAEGGKVVGVTHLFPSAPFPHLYEAGVGLVLKECRNMGINKQLLHFLYEEFVPRTDAIHEVFGEAVCNHPYMQKSLASFDNISTAIQVGLMPAAAYAKEKSAEGRVSTINQFRSYRPRPHRVFIPVRYEQELRRIYACLACERDILVSTDRIPGDQSSKAEMKIFDFAGVARISIPLPGEDMLSRLDELEAQARGRKAVVHQIRLDLSVPWVGETVERLRERGYFFGGLLPRWFDSDGLLMQRLEDSVDFSSIVLALEEDHRLLSSIQEDFEQVEKLSKPEKEA